MRQNHHHRQRVVTPSLPSLPAQTTLARSNTMNLFTITLSLLIAALSYYLYAIYSSYQRALKIGLPIVICPINPLNVAWLVASVPFRPILSRVLPRFLWQRLEIITYGFEFHTRGKPFFETFGKAYTLVAPGTIEVYVGDAELVSLVLSSRKGYEQAEMAAFVMGRFGPNVSSVSRRQPPNKSRTDHENLRILTSATTLS